MAIQSVGYGALISGLPEISIDDAEVGQARLACGAACVRRPWFETHGFAVLLTTRSSKLR